MARTNRGLSIRRSKTKVYIANDARIKTCISRYDNGAYTRIQFLNAVSHSVGAHSNALCEVDNQSDSDDETDGDAAAAEPQEQHTQPRSLTTMQSCVRCASSSHVNRVWHWFKRGSPHSTWLSTVPQADRCDSTFVLIFNSVGTVTDLRTFNSYF